MKRFCCLLTFIVISLVFACSKPVPQAEGKAIINDLTRAASSAAEKLDKAATAKEAAEIMKGFKMEMASLAEKGKEFDKKYPESNVMKDREFQPEREAFKESMKKYGISSMRAKIRFEGAKELEGID